MNKIVKAIIKPKPLSEAWMKRLCVVFYMLVILVSIGASLATGIASYKGAPGVLENDRVIWILGTMSGMFGMLALLLLISLAEVGIKILFKRFKK